MVSYRTFLLFLSPDVLVCVAVDAASVLAWLRAHPDVLERHIMDELELETLERWIIRKTQRAKKQTQGQHQGRLTLLTP